MTQISLFRREHFLRAAHINSRVVFTNSNSFWRMKYLSMIQKIVAPEIKEVLNLNRRMFKLVFQYNKFLLPHELPKKSPKKSMTTILLGFVKSVPVIDNYIWGFLAKRRKIKCFIPFALEVCKAHVLIQIQGHSWKIASVGVGVGGGGVHLWHLLLWFPFPFCTRTSRVNNCYRSRLGKKKNTWDSRPPRMRIEPPVVVVVVDLSSPWFGLVAMMLILLF